MHLWKVTGAFLLRYIFAELNSTQSFLVSIELQYVSGIREEVNQGGNSSDVVSW